jgi:hypothetical protein
MVCKLSFALLAVTLLPQSVLTQENSVVPKGPPPRFITVTSVDQAKGEVIFDIQVVAQNATTSPPFSCTPTESTG